MAECTACGANTKPGMKVCAACKAPIRSHDRTYRDPRHGLCEYNEHGMLCGKAGSIALHTGADGPWYCRQHALGLKGMTNKKSKLSIKEYMESVKEKAFDPEALEERISIQMESTYE